MTDRALLPWPPPIDYVGRRDAANSMDMHYATYPTLFDAERTGRLKESAELLLAACGREKTTLARHFRSGEEEVHVLAIVDAFHQSPLPEIFETSFGTRPVLNLTNTAIRRHRGSNDESLVGWHMDINFGLDDRPYLVAWTTLHDVGTERCGLEFAWPKAPISLQTLVQAWMDLMRSKSTGTFDDEALEKIFEPDGYAVRVPNLAAGGAIVFDQFVLHRTQVMDGPSEERISIEFRMADLKRPSKIFEIGSGVFAGDNDGDRSFFMINDKNLYRMSLENLRKVNFRHKTDSDG